MIGRLFRRFWYQRIWLRLVASFGVVLLLQITPVPQAPIDALRRAVDLSGMDRHEEAAQALGAVYLYNPWSAERLGFRVQEDLLGLDLGGAERDMERLAALRPLTTPETVTLAAIRIRQGNMGLAEQTWIDAINAGQVDPVELISIADLSTARQDWPSASAALLGLTIIQPGDAHMFYRLGLIQALDQPQAALGTLARATRLDRSLSQRVAPVEENVALRVVEPPEQIYAKLGTAYIGLAEFELAESALSRAHDINPAYGEALAYLAYTRAWLGRPALGAAHEALGLSPDSPIVHYLVGLTLRQMGRLHDARAEFETAYDLDPDNPAFAVEIASTHRAEHASQYAEIWLLEAVRLAPQDVRFRLLLAEFYQDDSYKLEDAGLPLAEQLVDEYPDNSGAHAVLGWASFRLGNTTRALEELNKAIEIDPTNARAQLHLGFVNEAIGNTETAIQHYQRASALDPQGAYGGLARRALERLGIK